jgi:predicted nucleic acid-binding protein
LLGPCVWLVLDDEGGRRAQRRFSRDWPDLARVAVTEALVARAETLAWDYGLRGYDAVQLAAAITWRDSVGEDVVLATFDRQLWEAAPQVGFEAWPEQLSGKH